MREKIESFRHLGRKESKGALADLAMETWGIDLNKQRSFDNMILDLESELMVRGIDLDLTSTQDSEASEAVTVEPEAEVVTPVESVEVAPEVKVEPSVDASPEEPVTPIQPVKLPEGFVPAFALTGREGYIVVPWWIHEWIEKTPDWKNNIDKCRIYNSRRTLETLVYYIEKNGSVMIRETRNSRFVVLQ